MNCDECLELTDKYIDNELSSDERTEIEKHISECESCRKEYEFAEGIMRAIHNMPEITPSADFLDKVNKRLDKELEKEKKNKIYNWVKGLTGIAAAMAIFAAVSNMDIPQIAKYDNKTAVDMVQSTDKAEDDGESNTSGSDRGTKGISESIPQNAENIPQNETSADIPENISGKTSMDNAENDIWEKNKTKNSGNVSVSTYLPKENDSQNENVTDNITENTSKDTIIARKEKVTYNSNDNIGENEDMADDIPKAEEIQESRPPEKNQENNVSNNDKEDSLKNRSIESEKAEQSEQNKRSEQSEQAKQSEQAVPQMALLTPPSDNGVSSSGGAASSGRVTSAGLGSSSGGGGGASGGKPTDFMMYDSSDESIEVKGTNSGDITIDVSDVPAAKEIVSKYSEGMNGRKYIVKGSDLQKIYYEFDEKRIRYSVSGNSGDITEILIK